MGENVNISKVIEFYSNITEENYKERFPVTYKFLNEIQEVDHIIN